MFSKKPERKMCPLYKKTCIGSDCMWALTVAGKNPNTGEDVNEEACAISWLPVLLMDNTKSSNQVGAAVESFRNEASAAQEVLNKISARSLGVYYAE